MKSILSKQLRTNTTSLISSLWKSANRQFGSLVEEKLQDSEKQSFIKLVDGESIDPYADYHLVKTKAGKILEETISSDLKESIKSFGQKGRSVFLLQNCPILKDGEELPATPSLSPPSSQRSQSKSNISEYFMLGVSDLIGADPYLIRNVRDGTVINQIIPTNPYSNSGSGSKVSFGLHNEVVHEEKVPDYFLLLALRGNPLAKTTYSFIEDIIQFLPAQILEELQKPNFLMKSGDTGIFKEAKELRCPIITTDKDGKQHIRLNTAPGRCEGTTPEAKIALKYLDDCLKRDVPIHGVALKDGEMLMVENGTTLHGRSEFEGDRWVQRMNLVKQSSQEKSSQER